MKKVPLEIWVIVITLVFSSFVAGYFTGRNHVVESEVILSQNQPSTQIESLLEKADSSEEQTPDLETPPSAVMSTLAADTPLLININTATIKELDNLPGVGPTLAQRIVDYRLAAGPFASPQELIEVSGIGENNLATMLPYIITQ